MPSEMKILNHFIDEDGGLAFHVLLGEKTVSVSR